MTEPSQAAREAAKQIYEISRWPPVWPERENKYHEIVQAAIDRETAAMEAELSKWREIAGTTAMSPCKHCGQLWPHVSVLSTFPVCEDCRRKIEAERDRLRADVETWKDTANQAMASEIRLKAERDDIDGALNDCVKSGMKCESELINTRSALQALYDDWQGPDTEALRQARAALRAAPTPENGK